MKFDPPLIEVTLLKRYKRFLADVEFSDGERVTVHCANSGSMKTCVGEGWKALISDSQNPKRKLRYTLERVHNGKTWIGVHPSRANALVQEAIDNAVIIELQGYESLRREVKYGEGSRVDLLLEDGQKPDCYVEVKSVSMMEEEVVMFPDAVTSRGLKHLHDLVGVVKKGQRAVLVLVVQRRDGKVFRPAADIDPQWSTGLREAIDAGVELLVYQVKFSKDKMVIADTLPYELD